MSTTAIIDIYHGPAGADGTVERSTLEALTDAEILADLNAWSAEMDGGFAHRSASGADFYKVSTCWRDGAGSIRLKGTRADAYLIVR